MRTYVVTGPAGSGSTSVAAALAAQRAAAGGRVALVRGGPGAEQIPDTAGVTGVVVDPLRWGESAWEAAAGLRRVAPEPWRSLDRHDVLPLPGLTEAAWWAALRQVWRGGFDAVVVDAGPLATAMAWLTLPDTVLGLLQRAWPMAERASAVADGVDAGTWHVRALAWFDSEAAELAGRLRSPASAVHLVTRPEPHQLERTLLGLAPLALFELPVTDLVVNHVVRRRRYDSAAVAGLAQQLPHLTVRSAVQRRTSSAPRALADELYPDGPGDRGKVPRPRIGRDGADYVWSWPLPFADPAAVAAVARGDDAILTVGSARRVVPLPSVLRRCRLRGADLVDGLLRLRFAPDPDLWPATWETS